MCVAGCDRRTPGALAVEHEIVDVRTTLLGECSMPSLSLSCDSPEYCTDSTASHPCSEVGHPRTCGFLPHDTQVISPSGLTRTRTHRLHITSICPIEGCPHQRAVFATSACRTGRRTSERPQGHGTECHPAGPHIWITPQHNTRHLLVSGIPSNYSVAGWDTRRSRPRSSTGAGAGPDREPGAVHSDPGLRNDQRPNR